MRKYLLSTLWGVLTILCSCDSSNTELYDSSRFDENDSFPKKYELTFSVKNASEHVLPIMYMEGEVFLPYEKDRFGIHMNCQEMEIGRVVSVCFDGEGDIPLVYDGVSANLYLQVRVKVGESLYYATTWKTPTDTLKNGEKSSILFNWPEDTLRAQKIKSEYKNSICDELMRFW